MRSFQRTFLGVFLWALFLALGASGVVHAYSVNGLYWSGSFPVVPYFINVSTFPSAIGTQNEVRDAIRKGVNEWSFQGEAKINALYSGTTLSVGPAQDGVSTFSYSGNNCTPVGYPPGTNCIAQAFWWPATGPATEFDIVFYGKDTNGATVQWKAADPVVFKNDIWGVAAHEFGHVLGLGHSTVYGAVMYDGYGFNTIQRNLNYDDIQGIQSIYTMNPDIVASGTSVKAGTPVTITVNYADAPARAFQFFATINGSSPGVDLNPLDPTVETRFIYLNPNWVDMLSLPSIFQNTVGSLSGSGTATMTFQTTGLAGICGDFAAAVFDSSSAFPSGIRHVTPTVHICVI